MSPTPSKKSPAELPPFSWESTQYPFPTPHLERLTQKRSFFSPLIVLQFIQLGTTIFLLFIFIFFQYFLDKTVPGSILDHATVVLPILLLISALFQSLSIWLVRKRAHFALAFAGATFGIFFIPISFVILGMLLHQKSYFAPTAQGPDILP